MANNLHEYLKETLRNFYIKLPFYQPSKGDILRYDTSMWKKYHPGNHSTDLVLISSSTGGSEHTYWEEISDTSLFSESRHYYPNIPNTEIKMEDSEEKYWVNEGDPTYGYHSSSDTFMLNQIGLDSKRHVTNTSYRKYVSPNARGNGMKMFGISYLIRYIDNEYINGQTYTGFIAIPFLKVAKEPMMVKKYWLDICPPEHVRYFSAYIKAYVLDIPKFIQIINDMGRSKYSLPFLSGSEAVKYLAYTYGINGQIPINIQRRDLPQDILLWNNYYKTFFDSDFYFSDERQHDNTWQWPNARSHPNICSSTARVCEDGDQRLFEDYNGFAELEIIDREIDNRYIEMTIYCDWINDSFFNWKDVTHYDDFYYDFGFCFIEYINDKNIVNPDYYLYGTFNDYADAIIAEGKAALTTYADEISKMGFPVVYT